MKKKLSELARLVLIKTICKGEHTFETGKDNCGTYGEEEFEAANELRRKGLIDITYRYFDLVVGYVKVVRCKKCKKILQQKGKLIEK